VTNKGRLDRTAGKDRMEGMKKGKKEKARNKDKWKARKWNFDIITLN
jgi:hypothetical protein